MERAVMSGKRSSGGGGGGVGRGVFSPFKVELYGGGAADAVLMDRRKSLLKRESLFVVFPAMFED
jgi:hypothetical protein